MIPPYRLSSVVLALLWVATPGAAQVTGIGQGATVDLAALGVGEVRVSVEPVVIGRSVLGISLGRWWGGGSALGVTPAADMLGAPAGDAAHPAREYLLDLNWRVYPKAFSTATPGLPLSGYLGAFVGVAERERDQSSTCPVGFACPLVASGGSSICACPLIAAPGSGPGTCSCPPLPAPQVSQVRAVGVEPGVEFGIRATPTEYLVFEVGAWARMITFPDPTGRFEQGQIDPRLTLSVGVRW